MALLNIVCWALILISRVMKKEIIVILNTWVTVMFELIGLEKERTTYERGHRLWNHIIRMQNMSQVISKGKRCYIP